jgi:hypothetical protein
MDASLFLAKFFFKTPVTYNVTEYSRIVSYLRNVEHRISHSKFCSEVRRAYTELSRDCPTQYSRLIQNKIVLLVKLQSILRRLRGHHSIMLAEKKS